jgi:hypothetical protein
MSRAIEHISIMDYTPSPIPSPPTQYTPPPNDPVTQEKPAKRRTLYSSAKPPEEF